MSALNGIAREVVVSLGPEDENSKFAMEIIERKFCPRTKTILRVSVAAFLRQTSDAELLAIAQLIAKEYWQRVWATQKIFRARRITVYCGYDGIQWASLSKFLRYIDQRPTMPEKISGKSRILRQCCTSPAKSLTEYPSIEHPRDIASRIY